MVSLHSNKTQAETRADLEFQVYLLEIIKSSTMPSNTHTDTRARVHTHTHTHTHTQSRLDEVQMLVDCWWEMHSLLL
jgi:hypothetical protein